MTATTTTTDVGMRLTLKVPPVNEPLTAAEARARLNIGIDVSDAVVEAYLMAARQRIDGADGYLGRALISQTWQGMLDAFPVQNGDLIYIPLPPLQQITSIVYLDSDGAPVTMDPASYQVVKGPRPYVVPAFGTTWPAAGQMADAVTVTFIAGYGDNGTDVPEPIRTAIALAANHARWMTRDMTVTQEIEEGIGATRYGGVTPDVIAAMDETVENLLSTYLVWSM
jgi:uncharacterized phiE125 gp8 family phage protein